MLAIAASDDLNWDGVLRAAVPVVGIDEVAVRQGTIGGVDVFVMGGCRDPLTARRVAERLGAHTLWVRRESGPPVGLPAEGAAERVADLLATTDGFRRRGEPGGGRTLEVADDAWARVPAVLEDALARVELRFPDEDRLRCGDEAARRWRSRAGRAPMCIVIWPEALQPATVAAITEELAGTGLVLRAALQRRLSHRDVARFYTRPGLERWLAGIVECRGGSDALVLAADGPAGTYAGTNTVVDALRGRFGIDARRNGIHSSENCDDAVNELRVVFDPDVLAGPALPWTAGGGALHRPHPTAVSDAS